MLTRTTVRALTPILVIFLLAGCLFALTYYHDNKYLTPPPYGEGGSLAFSDDDLERPLPLVDGWLLSVDGSERSKTFIGQYSNFSYVPAGESAFGSATYELTLHYEGRLEHRALMLLVPEIFTTYTIYVDKVAIATHESGAAINLIVDESTHLEIQVENKSHYYSGMTYPPVIGTARVLADIEYVNAFFTAVLVLVSSVAAVFAFSVRRRGKGDKLVRDFGILCVSFAVAGAHGLMWRLGLVGPWWYALEDAAWMLVLISSVVICMRVAGLLEPQAVPQAGQIALQRTKLLQERKIRTLISTVFRCLWVMPTVVFVWVAFVIPVLPGSIEAYGWFQTIMRLLCWSLFVSCAIVGAYRKLPEARYILYCCAVLGAALVSNVLDNNAYEPLYGLWQQEYAGLMVVGIFGWMLVNRVRRLRTAQEKMRDLEVQVHSAEEGLIHMRRSTQAVREARHELHHHVVALQQMAHSGAWDLCIDYLDELSEAQHAQVPLRYSLNTVANAVLLGYLAPAQAAGITVDCTARLPEELALRDTELVVLLSNVLANAIEACEVVQREGEQSPFIGITLDVKNSTFLLRCANSASKNASFGSTTKLDTEQHGFGLSALEQIAHKYQGTLQTEVLDGEAVVRIALRLPK